MILLISPAKNLNLDTQPPTTQNTQAQFLDHSQQLISICQQLTPVDLAQLMSISDKLATLNYTRFQTWQRPFTSDNAKQALFTFNGDVYTGLDAYTLSDRAIHYAQQHLCILSGLYGLLKPLDLIQPYRLEMGVKLTNPQGKNLYAYWSDLLTSHLNQLLSAQAEPQLINLASNEYFKVINTKTLQAPIITPQFKDWKNGQYKMIGFFAKKARGLMARYLIEQEIKTTTDLLDFTAAGYRYAPELSQTHTPVFTRKQST